MKRKKVGMLIGGSGLIGGTLVHYFKTHTPETIEVRAPSSKKLSIRSKEDISNYIKEIKPDFIINTAITQLSSSSKLSFEVNYIGAINLAIAAAEHKIPYIHITTAAALPEGRELADEETVAVTPELSNYAKSKLMAEKSLSYLSKTVGLDYTSIRLAIVYGNHDHKVQGFHRLFFSIADQSMPFLFTKKNVAHSYSNCRKIPFFVHHLLEHREEFSGNTYNFVDEKPIELSKLILTIRDHLKLKKPREIYLPYALAKSGKKLLSSVIRLFAKLGIVASMPQELIFLESFYTTQTLSAAKLQQSSFIDPMPEETVFTNLPSLADYYLKRWAELNSFSSKKANVEDLSGLNKDFVHEPHNLLQKIHKAKMNWTDLNI